MQLYYYQQDAVNAVLDHIENKTTNPCVEVPTGGGKTAIIATLCKIFVENDFRVMICAHRQELLEQAAQALKDWAPTVEVGIVSAGLKSRDYQKPVVVAGIQSVYNHAFDVGKIDFVIVDEAHLIPAEAEKSEGMYAKLLGDLKRINPNVTVIGLTATPYRLSSGEVCGPDNILNEICFKIGVQELIDAGKLAPLVSKAPPSSIDASSLHIVRGEYKTDEIEERFDESKVYEACSEIIRFTKNRKSVLIFTPSIRIAEDVCAELEKQLGSGDAIGSIFGSTGATERREIIERFKGKIVKKDLFGTELPPIKYLVNVDVLTTGFDAKNVDCVVLLRPTASPGLYSQMVGRGFRTFPGKENCLILDFGENMKRFGPVDAIIPPKKRGERDETNAKEDKMKSCPKCFDLVDTDVLRCGTCGFEFEPPNNDFLCPACEMPNNRANRFCCNCGLEFPRPKGEENFETTADFDSAILSSERKEVYQNGKRIPDFVEPVVKSSYIVGQNKRTGKPPYLMVKHRLESGAEVNEFVCLQHEGFAGEKARRWWLDHSKVLPIPATAEQALDVIHSAGIAKTETVEYSPASAFEKKYGKYPNFKKSTVGEKPEVPAAFARTDNPLNLRCDACDAINRSFRWRTYGDNYWAECVHCGAVCWKIGREDYADDETYRNEVEALKTFFGITFKTGAQRDEFNEFTFN